MKRSGIAAALLGALLSAPAAAVPDGRVGGLLILSGSFGTLGTAHELDIAEKLQGFCGSQTISCDVFCSETSFGRYNVGRHAICRVIYRCGDGSTRSVEAAREEPILIRCGNGDSGELAPAGVH